MRTDTEILDDGTLDEGSLDMFVDLDSFVEKGWLKPREWYVIYYKYIDPYPMGWIANALGVTDDRARQIGKVGLRRLHWFYSKDRRVR